MPDALVDEDHLVALAVPEEVLHRLRRPRDRDLDVVVPHQKPPARDGVSARRDVPRREVPVRVRVGHPLLAHDRLELAASRSPGTATAGGRGSTRGPRTPRSPSPLRSGASRCRGARCAASAAGRRVAGRTARMEDIRARIEQEVGSWEGVTVHAHRFGGVEFRLGAPRARAPPRGVGRPSVHVAHPRDAARDGPGRAAPGGRRRLGLGGAGRCGRALPPLVRARAGRSGRPQSAREASHVLGRRSRTSASAAAAGGCRRRTRRRGGARRFVGRRGGPVVQTST